MWCASGNRGRLPTVALAFALAAEQSWNGNGCGQSRDVQRAKCAVECRAGLSDVDAVALQEDILFSGRTEEMRITLISSIDQLGYFLDEYVLQPIGIKQRLMQLQRFF